SANLTVARLSGANLTVANLGRADLSRADLSRANLTGADLTDANLSGAGLSRANLSGATLSGSDLSGADLTGADLSGAYLIDANLTGANLSRAEFNSANLELANFTGTIFDSTALANVDLGTAKGLNSARHYGPSSIGIDTLYKSGGNIPEVFLRGCGVPDEFITFIPAILGAPQSIQFYSCFISYSTKDEEFSKRLYSRMRDEKLRVWFAPEDIKGGEKIHEQIERAIQIHDRLLIVLSENSLRSEWVMTEIRKARKAERKENRRKLFPIRLVDFETIQEWECFDADSGKDLGVEVREYFIPDFSNWKDHDAFEIGFKRLLRDLRAEESK
ncbi:MAG TPA: toll/interleukin-1 receptor domain-containing protein, partial [Blastocatellia bacterium]|nr:toll/interleukin-1 receptor domain-containing protein [Blastocatellia bacterium]